MKQSLTPEQAESLVRISRTADGQFFLERVAREFDHAMQRLLYAKRKDLPTAQGAARALHETLKDFDDAVKAIETPKKQQIG
jgi:hypothetical protein